MIDFESYKIVPGKGMDKIKLGMTMQEVEALIGEPEETEEHIYPEGDSSTTYSYATDGFDLTFESENNNRLSYVSVFSDAFHIDKKIRIGDSKEKVMQILQKDNYSDPEIEDYEEDFPGNELVYLKNENLNLWFTKDILDEIQFGPFWEDNENPIWP